MSFKGARLKRPNGTGRVLKELTIDGYVYRALSPLVDGRYERLGNYATRALAEKAIDDWKRANGMQETG